MNNAAAAVPDACDTAAPSPCASGCGELLPCLPYAVLLPLSLPQGLQFGGKLVKSQKKRGLDRTSGGGRCCLLANSNGNVSPMGAVLSEARGGLTAFQHCSLPPRQVSCVSLCWKAGAGVCLQRCCAVWSGSDFVPPIIGKTECSGKELRLSLPEREA